ncbi:hypothetical protein [Staphylococcus simulans]|uniref:Uncharacterized protein n=1 Tax=Staphylococcus simulans TaxID=1286 RepID=A0A6N2Z2P7_STASI|nr:hypothetical protein [Staphylococcus aureus]HDD4216943.1 hypothetical protein [Staphylococcus aureus]HDK4771656.1 hypothetical protein [Staphylococcus aureus]HDK4782592.1 hypothetical protein [Staphylococcus aureus]
MPTTDGLKEWFLGEAQNIFVICFIIAMVYALWKRSLALGVTFIVVGAVIGIFVFAPEAMQSLAEALRGQLGF